MEELVKVKNKIRNFIRNFDDIIIPILRLIWSYAVFSVINMHFGYVSLFSKNMFVLLVSILCALMPDALMLFLIGVIMGVNSFAVGLETGLFFIVLFIAMYCVYLRFFPKHLYIILVAFVAMHLSMSGLLPLFIGVIAGIAGVIPAAFGLILFYYSDVLKELDVMIKYSSEPDTIAAFNYLKDYFKDNKDLLTVIGAFAITIVVTGIIYRLSFKYAVYIAIGVGAITNLIAFSVVSGKLHTKVDMNNIFMSTVISLIFVLFFQFCKGFVDYRRTERVQFEDDEYYYYVKAVPKFGEDIDKAARKRVVKRKAGVVLSDKAVQGRQGQQGSGAAAVKMDAAHKVRRPGVQPGITTSSGDKAVADALKVADEIEQQSAPAIEKKAMEIQVDKEKPVVQNPQGAVRRPVQSAQGAAGAERRSVQNAQGAAGAERRPVQNVQGAAGAVRRPVQKPQGEAGAEKRPVQSTQGATGTVRRPVQKPQGAAGAERRPVQNPQTVKKPQPAAVKAEMSARQTLVKAEEGFTKKPLPSGSTSNMNKKPEKKDEE
ncbi:CDP-diglyceride synthetase [Eubacterium ruminantium]|nr:CDP-diglyceride synthetase [Eubacterium ruminantium]